jgi:hypothetical protein
MKRKRKNLYPESVTGPIQKRVEKLIGERIRRLDPETLPPHARTALKAAMVDDVCSVVLREAVNSGEISGWRYASPGVYQFSVNPILGWIQMEVQL